MKQASGHLQQPDGQEPVRVLLQHPHEKTPSQGWTGMISEFYCTIILCIL